MAPKSKGKLIKELIGKEVMILTKYHDDAEGPYIVTGVDLPLVSMHCPQRKKDFWFNLAFVVCLTESENVE